MKVRCPHCKHVFESSGLRGAQTCPNCFKTVLLPHFFGGKHASEVHSAVLHREALRRRRAAMSGKLPNAGMVFMKRPLRVFMVVALLLMFGGALLRKVRDPRDLAEPARIELALNNLATLRIAVERFRNDCGRYPTSREGLAALLLNPGVEGWNGPYILGLKPDPWRRAFQYRLDQGTPIITSLGADGIAGTALDLTAPMPPTQAVILDQGVYAVRPAD